MPKGKLQCSWFGQQTHATVALLQKMLLLGINRLDGESEEHAMQTFSCPYYIMVLCSIVPVLLGTPIKEQLLASLGEVLAG